MWTPLKIFTILFWGSFINLHVKFIICGVHLWILTSRWMRASAAIQDTHNIGTSSSPKILSCCLLPNTWQSLICFLSLVCYCCFSQILIKIESLSVVGIHSLLLSRVHLKFTHIVVYISPSHCWIILHSSNYLLLGLQSSTFIYSWTTFANILTWRVSILFSFVYNFLFLYECSAS